MTKCQKITFFDIFPSFCQNHHFPLFPIFLKNQKITLFHCGGDFCKIPHFPKNPIFDPFPQNPIFGHFGEILENAILAILGYFGEIPKKASFGHFLENPIFGLFTPYPKMVIFGRSRWRTSPTRTIWRGVSNKPLGSLSIFF